MPKVGTTRAYRYFADRYYLDRANRDNYIARDSATRIALSGGLLLAGALDLGTNLINNLTDPSGNQDADTKAARDAAIAVHAALNTLHAKVVLKTADETVNNSSTLQNDDELLFAMAANEVWFFIFIPIIDSGTTPDIKVAAAIPTGAVVKDLGVYEDNNAGDTIQINAISSARALRGLGAGTVACVGHFIGVVINGGTAGNFQIQFAQNTQDASDTKMKANSCLIAIKLA